MAEDPQVIRAQMEQTRASLSEKIEALEQHVVETVHGATGAVADTVDTLKEAAQETVGTVKETVQQTVRGVRDAFDVPLQVSRHPWFMVGGSVVVGYVAGTMLAPDRLPRSRGGEPAVPESGNGRRQALAESSFAQARGPRFVDKLGEALGPEIDKFKRLAIGVSMGLLRDLVAGSAQGDLGAELRRMIDDVTERLGGKTFKEPILAEGRDQEMPYQRPPGRAAGVRRF
jgi:ElaB/YqjD/DUF883 family membrane-anchored ribosome-binding protein